MSVSLTLDSKAFGREINQLRVLLKKSGAEVVKQEAKLFVRDAMKMTPPCGRHAVTESWASQRKLGLEAVARDVTKMFLPLAYFLPLLPERPRRYFQRYISSRNKKAIRTMLEDFKITVPVIVDEATTQLHDQGRNAMGRVPKGSARFFVCDARSIKRLINLRQTHVGKGKAGWMEPAKALGLTVPNWISTHAVPGVWRDRTATNGNNPYIDVGNLVPHANDAGQRLGIAQAAMLQRRRSIRIRIDKMVRYLAKKRPLPFLP